MRISTYIRILKELESWTDYERYKKAVCNTDGVHVWLNFNKGNKRDLFGQVGDFGCGKTLNRMLRGS